VVLVHNTTAAVVDIADGTMVLAGLRCTVVVDDIVLLVVVAVAGIVVGIAVVVVVVVDIEVDRRVVLPWHRDMVVAVEVHRRGPRTYDSASVRQTHFPYQNDYDHPINPSSKRRNVSL